MNSRAEIKRQALSSFKAHYGLVLGITVLIGIIDFALSCTGVGYLIYPVIYVGFLFFTIAAYFADREAMSLDRLFTVGFNKFGRNLGSMLLQALMLFGWTMLLIIPGIIKAFSYAMAPYILADCPEVGAVDAITISRRMMNGHKWELFVLELSFIGWYILGLLTFGLVNLLYATPYRNLTVAGYYVELKKYCIEQGVVSVEQFSGGPVE